MNYINCIIRLLEIPKIELFQNETPKIEFDIEIANVRNRETQIIIKAFIWGDLTYTLTKYYRINDYLLIEGYILNDSIGSLNLKNLPKINILQIYPLFIIN